MCGGAILAEIIPPTRRVASKPVTEGHLWPANSKKAGSGRDKRHHHEYADDDFEAAFEEFEELDDEDDPDHFVFSSKSAFSPGTMTGVQPINRTIDAADGELEMIAYYLYYFYFLPCAIICDCDGTACVFA